MTETSERCPVKFGYKIELLKNRLFLILKLQPVSVLFFKVWGQFNVTQYFEGDFKMYFLSKNIIKSLFSIPFSVLGNLDLFLLSSIPWLGRISIFSIKDIYTGCRFQACFVYGSENAKSFVLMYLIFFRVNIPLAFKCNDVNQSWHSECCLQLLLGPIFMHLLHGFQHILHCLS